MIKIGNKGPLISETNFFESEIAEKGLFFLSWNAGVARLLVPKSMENYIDEMHADYVIVSRGFWKEADVEGLELLFEDNSDNPFVLHLSASQTDRLLPESDQGSGFEIHIYTQQHLAKGPVAKLPGKYRAVETIPCLDPWRQ